MTTGRLKQGIDDRHISRGIFERPGSNRPVLDGERKSIRLERVLIDRIERDLSAVKISYAGSVANVEMAAGRLWMSKRKLNADPPTITENMDVLVGGGFCCHRQCGVAGRKVENRTGENIDAGILITNQGGQHPVGFVPEYQSCDSNRVTANVVYGTAPHFWFVAIVVSVFFAVCIRQLY